MNKTVQDFSRDELRDLSFIIDAAVTANEKDFNEWVEDGFDNSPYTSDKYYALVRYRELAKKIRKLR